MNDPIVIIDVVSNFSNSEIAVVIFVHTVLFIVNKRYILNDLHILVSIISNNEIHITRHIDSINVIDIFFANIYFVVFYLLVLII